MKQTLTDAVVEDETEKGLLVSVNYWYRETQNSAKVEECLYPIWIPKSHCFVTRQGIQVTQWMLEKLEERIADKFGYAVVGIEVEKTEDV